MFKDSGLRHRQITASSFTQAFKQYTAAAESWFDGSIGSIDKRLAACDKLIHSARSTVARLNVTDSHGYLTASQHLASDREALAGLREDLLTGGAGRAEVSGPAGWRP